MERRARKVGSFLIRPIAHGPCLSSAVPSRTIIRPCFRNTTLSPSAALMTVPHSNRRSNQLITMSDWQRLIALHEAFGPSCPESRRASVFACFVSMFAAMCVDRSRSPRRSGEDCAGFAVVFAGYSTWHANCQSQYLARCRISSRKGFRQRHRDTRGKLCRRNGGLAC